MSSKYAEGDVVKYAYQSGGFWRTVIAEVLDVETDVGCYRVKIADVVKGPEKLASGTKIVGKERSPRIEWVDSRGIAVRSSNWVGSDAVTVSSNVSTVDELFEASGMVKDEWDVDRLTVTAQTKEDTTSVQQIWARLRPNKVSGLRDKQWQEEFLTKVRNLSRPLLTKSVVFENSGLVSEINLSDVHIRMLSWEKETNVNYNVDISASILKEAGVSLIDESMQNNVERLKIVLGGDLFHTDQEQPFTKKGGNLLDVDSRYTKAFEKGFEVCKQIVDYALTEYGVRTDIYPISGNHDFETMYHLGKTLEAFYSQEDGVFVDTSPKVRKYYEWGKCIVCLEHGDETKAKDMPQILQHENPHISWLTHPYREVHRGHIHTEIAKDIDGTIVRWVSALAPADYYHFSKGYTRTVKGSQAFIFDKNRGLKNILYHRVDYPLS